MLLTSPIFLFVFLPALLIVYYVISSDLHTRNYIAFAGSTFFFAWCEPIFVFALIVATFISYRVSLLVAKDSRYLPQTKRLILGSAIALNVTVLIVSKYSDFVVKEIINPLEPWHHFNIAPLNIPLILGISFITFHLISYLVDSYKGCTISPRGFLDCALYIFFFPKLIAGPIIRYDDIGHQIHSRRHTVEGFLTGFNRLAIGLSKKLIIADPLGILADKIFGYPAESLSFTFAWGGILAFTLQIYFDFSGYSDMAIGLGRMMGFRFPENFNSPYISRSVTEFWRRWHISLSNWMRLYLYIPLGGNRASVTRIYFNLWVVFLISGIWHGASWNFVVWGAYYGFFLSFERAISKSWLSWIELPDILRWSITLLIVMIGWVFFRSSSLEHAFRFIGIMFSPGNAGSNTLPPWGLVFGNRDFVTMLAAVLIACLKLPGKAEWLPAALRAAWSDSMTLSGSTALTTQFIITLALVIVSASAMVSADYVPFLYFRF